MLKCDASKRNMVIVSTCDRKDLTGITLDSIARNKHPWTKVVIQDDASTEYDQAWLEQWGFRVCRNKFRMGVGSSAWNRLDFAANHAEYGYDFFILCDNDLVFTMDFDSKLRSLWELVSGKKKLSLISGYRSVAYDTVKVFADHVQVQRIGGACMAMDRRTAGEVLKRVSQWDTLWDQQTAAFKCYAPIQSVCQHLGTHGTGVNGMSWDRALMA